ncbi:hypothetical protein PVK06_042652 [Gossypium arboreum]|uniref:Uncharacterized protein n=1 Tax=Gossypium arboreum TaxID=29729 RepID=A0ABR0MLB6_GOSAR|nr:hypothetical protein PVK06_042652 [Gossypium arboreum]
MKQTTDCRRNDREFKVGDYVYLKLQPSKQHTMKRVLNQKLSPQVLWSLYNGRKNRKSGLSVIIIIGIKDSFYFPCFSTQETCKKGPKSS